MLNNPAAAGHLLWLLPLLGGLVWFAWSRRRQRLATLLPNPERQAALTASVDPRRRWAREFLITTAIVLAALSLVRPQTLPGETLTRPARGRDVLVLLDVSRSMLADDVPPSRLVQARALVTDLAARLPGDRFGLIGFAGVAFLQCPLTFNRPSFQLVLNDTDTLTIPIGGSNLEKALTAALDAFAAAEGPHRVIVLISDGEELQGDARRLLERVRRRHIPVHVIGMGDPELGSFIQLPDKQLLQVDGKPVRTRLNEPMLKQIAAAGNGLYRRWTPEDSGAEELAAAIASLSAADHQEELRQEKPRERFQWLLGAAILMLLAFLGLGERRSVVPSPVVSLLVLALLLPATLPAREHPDSEIRELRDQIEHAVDLAEFARLQYNLAHRYQEREDDTAAEEHYDTAIASGGATAALRAAAYQNLGVMLHERAGKVIQSDPATAVTQLEKAVKHYSEALRLRPDDRELAANLELARRDLERARANLKIKQQLDAELGAARTQTKKALNQQQQANAKDAPDTAQDQADTDAGTALDLVRKLVKTAALLAQEKDYVKAAGELEAACQGQQQLAQPEADAGLPAAVVAHLRQALLLLGGQPDPDQNDQQEKDPKNGNQTSDQNPAVEEIIRAAMQDEERLNQERKDNQRRYREPEGEKNW